MNGWVSLPAGVDTWRGGLNQIQTSAAEQRSREGGTSWTRSARAPAGVAAHVTRPRGHDGSRAATITGSTGLPVLQEPGV